MWWFLLVLRGEKGVLSDSPELLRRGSVHSTSVLDDRDALSLPGVQKGECDTSDSVPEVPELRRCEFS